jgi:hypothetical protein
VFELMQNQCVHINLEVCDEYQSDS